MVGVGAEVVLGWGGGCGPWARLGVSKVWPYAAAMWCTGWGCGEEEEEEVLHLDVRGWWVVRCSGRWRGDVGGYAFAWGMCCGVVEGSGVLWVVDVGAEVVLGRVVGVVGRWVRWLGSLPCCAQGGVAVRERERRGDVVFGC